jgi:glycosyltransferase involved in cell wall biosynthesis
MRPSGLSAFVRCKNEEEYIVASLMSVYRVFDEIVVILNNSTDRTRELVEDLMVDHPKIRMVTYDTACAAAGPGYQETVRECPEGSLAKYYNWCLEETRYSHVCKWDGDMIAIPFFERARELIGANDVVLMNGHDVLGECTTDWEPRIFRFDPLRARYVDWELYEVLEHDYWKVTRVEEKCYVHMKLVKRDWLHKQWVSPNVFATTSAPATGGVPPSLARKSRIAKWVRELPRRVLRGLGVQG